MDGSHAFVESADTNGNKITTPARVHPAGRVYSFLTSKTLDFIGCFYDFFFIYILLLSLFLFARVAGEVERLLRDYRQNQELVRNIGANYYQIIYPVQIRHHDKMGISTREVGSQKVSSG